MVSIKVPKDCSGCSACAFVCNHKAIEMKEDALGFLYPKVNIQLCIGCGLCDKSCQFTKSYSRYDNYDSSRVYLARHKNPLELKKSQSGGLFYAIGCEFIQNIGIVYGAAFDKGWKVTHFRVDDVFGLDRLRMSKYVQSDISHIYQQIRSDLIRGNKVLFSGTPCQVSGIKAALPMRLHENLYCIDIVCHSVPSPKIWKDYIDYLQQRNGKIVDVKFRDKTLGWRGSTESFTYQNSKKEYRKTSNYMFFNHLSIRDSCTNCPFTNMKRVGDITLGDFWGLSNTSPYNDNKGVSLVLVNSRKGEELINSIQSIVHIEHADKYEYLQPQLMEPVKPSPIRDKFIKEYTAKGFIYIAKKYSDCGVRYKLNTIIKNFKNKIKAIIRK